MSTMQHIGVFGMATMGRNLALNIESHGFSVSIFNRSAEKVKKVIAANPNKKLVPYYSISKFVHSLEKPRRILLMIEAGKSTDRVIDLIKPFLDKGDILIDGGNSFYKDTIRRNYELSKNGFNFIGVGISGGEEGALYGPSIMAGGQEHAYKFIAPILEKIAAKANDEVCASYVGSDGAGHYVKMIHNGIEYSNMQLIAEVYLLLKTSLGMSNEQLADIFGKWNEGELNSYLINITKNILIKKDQEGKYIIDFILDEIVSKGTGKWASQSALDLDESLNLTTESVFARSLSLLKQQRIEASKILSGPRNKDFIVGNNKLLFIEKIRQALYLGKIISYAQGFSQLKAASRENKWNLNFYKIAKIFRAGCIIRAKFLQEISNVYHIHPTINNLLLAPYFRNIASNYQQALRDIVSYAVQYGTPIPAFSSAITYYDSYRSAVLPANLIQAQRDCFGAHTYKRTDKKGTFHTKWLE
ncbi:NADP-dependent phosphogluconate dehydrogenase [Sodalis sp. CWE]|uniref:NADP-dependent phosphogluconate dehydrogenase n=1 Tax=Sodalis sp. CWE TaxID=2803816 RepID=UPI001C7CA026|nr:NADP-dependent phosphogluconate dehydrogenase [Sodalis sp. CWE]MBX4181232.1 NADP-dependent phosphogluconate dehydrogenase [Sodalis sp. CWE]